LADKKPANLAEALIAFQANVPTIDENSSSFHGKFADLPHILSVIGPTLRECGLAVSQTPTHIDGQPGLKTLLMHTSGEQIVAETPLVMCSGKSATQEWGKAMTYQRRYALQSVLNLCAGIEDNDADPEPAVRSATTATQTQEKQPAAKAKPDENILGAKLTDDVKAQWVDFIKAAPADWRSKLVKAFATQFETGNRKVSNEITHVLHTVFLKEYTDKNPIPEVAAK
jgi:hypothetical protein